MGIFLVQRSKSSVAFTADPVAEGNTLSSNENRYDRATIVR